MTRRLSALAVASAALIVAACGQQTEKAPVDGGVVNLYTARHYASDEQVYEAFTKATGIQVRKIEVAADQLVERMKSEGAGDIPVVIGGMMPNCSRVSASRASTRRAISSSTPS